MFVLVLVKSSALIKSILICVSNMCYIDLKRRIDKKPLVLFGSAFIECIAVNCHLILAVYFMTGFERLFVFITSGGNESNLINQTLGQKFI